jgi:predicted transcriptional regulator
MAKAVLISIRPEWVEKIARGEKTVEVRKTRPKLDTPFKCYIYETKARTEADRTSEKGADAGKVYGRGMVVAEFICDEIKRISIPYPPTQADLDMPIYENSCLSYEQVRSYCKDSDAFFWHISSLKIYDSPEPLSEFARLRETKFGYELLQLDRAPQSWCYVPEKKEEN